MNALASWVAKYEAVGRDRHSADFGPRGRFTPIIVAATELKMRGKEPTIAATATLAGIPSGTYKSWRNRSKDLMEALEQVGSGTWHMLDRSLADQNRAYTEFWRNLDRAELDAYHDALPHEGLHEILDEIDTDDVPDTAPAIRRACRIPGTFCNIWGASWSDELALSEQCCRIAAA